MELVPWSEVPGNVAVMVAFGYGRPTELGFDVKWIRAGKPPLGTRHIPGPEVIQPSLGVAFFAGKLGRRRIHLLAGAS